MFRCLVLLLPLLVAGCAGVEDSAFEVTASSVGPSVTASHSPAPVLDTPSTVPAGLLVNTSKPALLLRIDVRQVKLVQADSSRTLTVDRNELIFAGRHIMAHDSLGVVEILVAGQICQDPASAQWVPYSARVTLSNGEFIYGCAQDAPLD